AWFYVHGYLPEQEVDHINRIRSDNRIENLRLATRSENAKNKEKSKANTSGFKGVSQQKKTGNWVAHIRLNGKNKHLGTFRSPERASIAYRIASHFHHKEFSPKYEVTNG
ncbi:HNH endonuclease, partial [Enterobacter cloacae subsp. cloacae]